MNPLDIIEEETDDDCISIIDEMELDECSLGEEDVVEDIDSSEQQQRRQQQFVRIVQVEDLPEDESSVIDIIDIDDDDDEIDSDHRVQVIDDEYVAGTTTTTTGGTTDNIKTVETGNVKTAANTAGGGFVNVKTSLIKTVVSISSSSDINKTARSVTSLPVVSSSGSSSSIKDKVTSTFASFLQKKPKLFFKKWMNNPMFKAWLRPFTQDKTKARCIACDCVLSAGLSELTKHALTAKHERAMLAAKQSSSSSTTQQKADNTAASLTIAGDGRRGNGATTKTDQLTKWRKLNRITSTGKDGRLLSVKPIADDYDDLDDDYADDDNDEDDDVNGDDDDLDEASGGGGNLPGERSRLQRTRRKMKLLREAVIAEVDLEEEKRMRKQNKRHQKIALKARKLDELRKAFDERVKNRSLLKRTRSEARLGKRAPFWKSIALINGHLTELQSTDYLRHYLVIFFFPLHFDRVSTDELRQLDGNISKFRDRNTDLIACSTESYDNHRAWLKSRQQYQRQLRQRSSIMEQQQQHPELDVDDEYDDESDYNNISSSNSDPMPYLRFPILSDTTHLIAELYGCYSQSSGHALRATYVVDTKGRLRYASLGDKAIGRNLNDLFRVIDAIRKADGKYKIK